MENAERRLHEFVQKTLADPDMTAHDMRIATEHALDCADCAAWVLRRLRESAPDGGDVTEAG